MVPQPKQSLDGLVHDVEALTLLSGHGNVPVKKKTITVVHCWTAPRSRSTALLYSFEARGQDCCVAIDEPLKREWLMDQGDKVFRPYKYNMIAGIPPDHLNTTPDEAKLWERETLSLGERIRVAAEKLSKTDSDDCVIFCKHMSKTHYLLGDFDNDVKVEPVAGVVLKHRHMFLIRDPTAILRSWDVLSSVHNESCSVEDVGIVPLVSILEKLEKRGDRPVIVDTDSLVADPIGVLQRLCLQLGIPYKPSMMTWKAGPHECDSRHAPWWYINAHNSTGWLLPADAPNKHVNKPRPEAIVPLNPKLMPALQESFPAYEKLLGVHQGGPVAVEATNTIVTIEGML